MVDAATRDVAAVGGGNAVGRQMTTIPVAGLAAGSYQDMRVYKCGKPGAAETRLSASFAITTPDPQVVAEPLSLVLFPTLVPVEPAL